MGKSVIMETLSFLTEHKDRLLVYVETSGATQCPSG